MGYDIDYREGNVTALDTATAINQQGADAPGAFVVPLHASAITEIVISVAAGYTTDVIQGYITTVHLAGPGLNAPESWINGPGGSTTGAANIATSMIIMQPQRILCNIPVKPGQNINCWGFMTSSLDVGEIQLCVGLVYDGPVRGNAKWFDCREGDLAAANTLVSLVTRGGAAEADFSVGPSTITDVLLSTGGVGVAGILAAPITYHLSGNGLSVAGNYKFLGHTYTVETDLGTIASHGNGVVGFGYKTSIPCQTGQIRVQSQMIDDDAGTPTVGVTFGFA